MDDEPSRRSLLSTSAVFGFGLLAGCGQLSRGDETRTPAESEPATASQPSETPQEPVLVGEPKLDSTSVIHGETVTASITLENTGDTEITRTLPLSVGGTQLAAQTLTLAPGESLTVELTGIPPKTGTQVVEIGSKEAGTVVVRAPKPGAVRDVGAHYYPWYGAPLHDFNEGDWSTESPSTPVLGNYNSTEPDVIEKHIDWCRRAGISWLNVSWWGPNSGHDTRLREDILAHPRADELEWSILYETVGRFGRDSVKLDDTTTQSRFTKDLSYLADTYFDREEYKHIDGRPVLYVWVGQNLRGDVQAAYETAVDAAGQEPYLIVDIPTAHRLDTHPIVTVADAVTTYSVYDPRNPTKDAFIEAARSSYRTWYQASEYVDVDIIPTAMPGFDNTEITHVERDDEPIPSTPEIYEATATAARRYADGPVLVTSFNEWYEDTQIEPSEEHGTAYLDLTADELATGQRESPTFDGETFTLQFERTVPESEMNSDIENGRQLTFMLHRLTIRNGHGEVVLDADIGTGVDDVTLLLGSYGREQAEENTWQWLGGTTKSVLSVPSLPEAGHIELTGLGAGEMDVTLEIDDRERDTTEIGAQTDTYTLSFE